MVFGGDSAWGVADLKVFSITSDKTYLSDLNDKCSDGNIFLIFPHKCFSNLVGDSSHSNPNF